MSRARDFTLTKYAEVCAAIVDAGYAAAALFDYLQDRSRLPPSFVLLRHDVESRGECAVAMAEVEARHGLPATYLMRRRAGGFHGPTIARLRALGHDIGYHYDTVARAHGDIAHAREMFARDLEELRRHGPVGVASMHGSPLLPWDNRDLWSTVRPADFGLAGEVYADIDYADVAYFSDTGRTWHPTRHNLRDHVAVAPPCAVDGTDELIVLLRARRFPRLCLLAHPDRWSSSTASWAVRAVRDGLENGIKDAVAWLYRPRAGTSRP